MSEHTAENDDAPPVPHREFARCAMCERDIARWEGMWQDEGGWWHLDDDVAHDHRARVIPPEVCALSHDGHPCGVCDIPPGLDTPPAPASARALPHEESK